MQTAITNAKRAHDGILARSASYAEREVQQLALIMWNHDVATAFEYFNLFIRNHDDMSLEVSVSWIIESRAFPGTNWELLFNLICGE